MPDPETLQRARRDREEGKSASTQAGEFVREEMHHIREGKHGAASTKQAIAIGLSKARRAGVDLPPPDEGTASEATRTHAEHDVEQGREAGHRPSRKRSRAVSAALKRQPRKAASSAALGRQAKQSARKRSAASRSTQARRAAKTRKRKK